MPKKTKTTTTEKGEKEANKDNYDDFLIRLTIAVRDSAGTKEFIRPVRNFDF